MTDRPETSTTPDPTDRGRVSAGATNRSATTGKPTAGTDQSDAGLRFGLPIALWTVSVVASWMAATGQYGTSEWAGITGPLRFGLPVITEAFAVTLLLLGYWQGREQRSPYPLWGLAWSIGAIAGYLNYIHAGQRQGLIFAMATVVCIFAWNVKYKIKLTNYLTRVGAIPPPRPKLGKLFIAAPRVAVRAWLVAVRRGVTTTERATDLAERWIRVYEDLRASDQPRNIAKRAAWDDIYDRTGGVREALPTTVRIDRVRGVETPTEPTDRPGGDRPDPEPTVRPTADRRQPTGRARSTRPPGRPNLHVVRPTATANAARLRELYPDGLPTDQAGQVIVRQIRAATNWSYERAMAAVKAYEQNADRDDDDHRALVSAA